MSSSTPFITEQTILNNQSTKTTMNTLYINDLINAPQKTTANRDLLVPQNGSIVYNTTTNKLQVYSAGAWVDLH